MKKFLLLIAGGLAVSSVNAQQNQSIVLTSHPSANVPKHVAPHTVSDRFRNHAATANKATGGTGATYSDWYALNDQNFIQGTSTNYYFEVAADSNLIDNSQSPAYNVSVHGMGMSFDPTDSFYYSYATVSQVSQPIQYVNSYSVDSFEVEYQYMMNNATPTVPDSLIVDLIVTPTSSTNDSGAYRLRFTTATLYDITADGTPRFGDGIYSPFMNDMYDTIRTQKLRFAYALTTADTVDQDKVIGLPAPLYVAAGTNVVSFVHFTSGTTYALNTDINSGNYLKLFAGEPLGAQGTWFPQSASNTTTGYPGSYQDGLWATNQNLYPNATNEFGYNGHNILIPSYAYDSNPGFDVPLEAFHINWTDTFHTAGVATVAANTTVNAYPNPAVNNLTIAFSLASSADVTVKLTNALGQVVSTQNIGNTVSGKANFNTAAFANGVYFYTVEANGNRTTGNVVVAH